MKSLLRNVLGLLMVVLTVAYVVMFFWASVDVNGEILIGYAQNLAKGMVPWQDFGMSASPLGVILLGMLYRTFGVQAFGAWALGFMAVVHLLNVIMMIYVLSRIHLHRIGIYVGVLLYLVMMFSALGWSVNMTPLAVLFMLAAMSAVMQKGIGNAMFAGIWMTLAIATEIHTVLLLPAVMVLAFWHGRTNHVHWQKGLLFFLFTLVMCVLAFIVVTALVGDTGWWRQVWFLRWPGEPMWADRLVAAGCESLRVLAFLLLFIPFLWKKLTLYARRFNVMALLAWVALMVIMLSTLTPAIGALTFPFFAIAWASLLTGTLTLTGTSFQR